MLSSQKAKLKNYIEFYSTLAGMEMSEKLNIKGDPKDIIVYEDLDMEDIPEIIKEV